jgi:drug/metabolite transporter (DMT)-like permease
VVLRSNVIGLLGLVLVAPLFAADHVRSADLGWGAGGGLVGGIGVLLLYRGLAVGTMSVVAPITAVLAAAVPVAVGLVDGERPSALALVGIPVALLAIALLARDPADTDHADEDGGAEGAAPAVLLTAMGAGLGFGLFFVALDRAGDDAGMWPLVAGRGASVALFALIALLVRSVRAGGSAAREGTTPWLLLACGIFLLATHEGLLTLVAVLGSLYPASTVVLATSLTHERLARVQVVGVVLALVAVVLITLG